MAWRKEKHYKATWCSRNHLSLRRLTKTCLVSFLLFFFLQKENQKRINCSLDTLDHSGKTSDLKGSLQLKDKIRMDVHQQNQNFSKIYYHCRCGSVISFKMRKLLRSKTHIHFKIQFNMIHFQEVHWEADLRTLQPCVSSTSCRMTHMHSMSNLH